MLKKMASPLSPQQTQGTEMLTVKSRDVTCPICHSGPGQECTFVPKDTVHSDRVVAAINVSGQRQRATVEAVETAVQ